MPSGMIVAWAPAVAKDNHGDIRAAHDGKGGCNTEYTTAFLISDWLCFLWHAWSKLYYNPSNIFARGRLV